MNNLISKAKPISLPQLENMDKTFTRFIGFRQMANLLRTDDALKPIRKQWLLYLLQEYRYSHKNFQCHPRIESKKKILPDFLFFDREDKVPILAVFIVNELKPFNLSLIQEIAAREGVRYYIIGTATHMLCFERVQEACGKSKSDILLPRIPTFKSSKSQLITIKNFKGGVGKTVITINLATTLVKQGNSVLIVDLDPQANASAYARVDESSKFIKVLGQHQPVLEAEELIQHAFPDYVTGLDIISSHNSIHEFNRYDFPYSAAQHANDFLAGLGYDYVLFDTSPGMDKLSELALWCSPYIIVPITPDLFSERGIDSVYLLQSQLELIKRKPEILGFVLNKFVRNYRVSKDTYAHFKEKLDTQLFSTLLRQNTYVTESMAEGYPLPFHSKAADYIAEYEAFANELVARIKQRQAADE